MLFSIVVPIYNVEKYLSQCIESVLNQDFSDFELILVDDGSTDSSGEICDEYAKNDDRIRVIHKLNGGVSDARNIGISKANGEFVCFLDSDDFMAKFAISDLADFLMNNDNIDMITCAHIDEYNDGSTKVQLLPLDSLTENMNRSEFLLKLYNSNGAYWAPWKNLYRKSVIEKNNLKFEKGLNCSEDCDFFMEFVNCGEKFTIFNTPIVHYRIDREGSITNNVSKSALLDRLKVYSKHYCIFNNLGDTHQYMKVFFSNKFANGIYPLYQLTNKTEINEVTTYIKENKSILKDTKGIKYAFAKIVWKLLGFYMGSKILRRVNSK